MSEWEKAYDSMESLRKHMINIYEEYLSESNGDIENAYALTVNRLHHSFMTSLLRAGTEDKVSAIVLNIVGLAVHSTVKSRENDRG